MSKKQNSNGQISKTTWLAVNFRAALGGNSGQKGLNL